MKSPALAGVMSALLPGSGQLYAGSLQAAAVTFVLNSLFIGATVELARDKLYVTAAAAGTAASFFYLGGIINAADLARRRNRIAQQPYADELEELLVPEVGGTLGAVRRALVILLLLGRVASAHQTSVKYVDVTLDDASAHGRGEGRAERRHRAARACRADSKPSVADVGEVAGGRAVRRALDRDRELRRSRARAARAAAAPDEDGKFVVVTWTVACPRIATDLDFTRFFALDTRHVAIVHVAPGARRRDRARDAIRTSCCATQPVAARVGARTGMDHIYTGRDHISFVLALLLVVMLCRGNRTWELRGAVATLRATATVITAFTIAHSISLIAASLGWVHAAVAVRREHDRAVDRVHRDREHRRSPTCRGGSCLTFGVRPHPRPRVREHARGAAAAERRRSCRCSASTSASRSAS